MKFGSITAVFIDILIIIIIFLFFSCAVDAAVASEISESEKYFMGENHANNH